MQCWKKAGFNVNPFPKENLANLPHERVRKKLQGQNMLYAVEHGSTATDAHEQTREESYQVWPHKRRSCLTEDERLTHTVRH